MLRSAFSPVASFELEVPEAALEAYAFAPPSLNVDDNAGLDFRVDIPLLNGPSATLPDRFIVQLSNSADFLEPLQSETLNKGEYYEDFSDATSYTFYGQYPDGVYYARVRWERD